MADDGNRLILAVDTCSGQSSIALARFTSGDFTLLGQTELAAEWTSTALHVEISRLLHRHHLTTGALDGYVVTNGPGSFTAVRVGTAAVKGLAEVHGKRVVAVSTLALIAQAAAWSQPEAGSDVVWAPLLDARRAQVFSGLYQCGGGRPSLVEPETVSALRVVLDRCSSFSDEPARQVRFCSSDMEPFAETIAAAGYSQDSILSMPPALGATLARMGAQALADGGGVDPLAVDANYIRASDAELFWKG